MTCERYRELLWMMLDGEALPEGADIKSHAASCPECRAYAERAMRLERLMPQVLEAGAPARSVVSAVMALVKEERERSGPAGAWIPAGAALATALCCSVWRWTDLSPAEEYLPLPSPEMLPSAAQLLAPVEDLISGAAGAEPFLVAATCALAAALWISTQWSLLKEAGRRNHG